MSGLSEAKSVELICVIGNNGSASKFLKSAKSLGISGGTVALGKGTVNNRILCYMGLSDVRKEILFMVSDCETAYNVLDKLNEKFELYKPHHGIVFTTTICSVTGSTSICCDKNGYERGLHNNMYHVITVIVDKGKAEGVISAATKAGSNGGTIINARGSGIHETKKLFQMEIEPEKEIVIILSEAEKTEDIVSSIGEKLDIDHPGNGIIYVQCVNKTFGIYRAQDHKKAPTAE